MYPAAIRRIAANERAGNRIAAKAIAVLPATKGWPGEKVKVSGEWSFQLLPNAPLERADVIVQPVCYERSTCFRGGTAAAPQAILEALNQLEYYEEDLQWSPMKYLRPHVVAPLRPDDGEGSAVFLQRLRTAVAALPRQALYIGLGGEHSITPEQVSARMPSGTVVVIDAHADLRRCYRGDPLSHACPAWRLHEAGYQLVLIGLRSLFEDEAVLMREADTIDAWMDRDLRDAANWKRLLQSLEALQGPVWLSLDMDGFDPALVPGVGTPQPGGLDWYQGVDIVRTLLQNPAVELRGMDLLELVPDSNCVSQTVAAKLIQKAISYWAWPRVSRDDPPRGAQTEVDYS